MGDRFYFSPDAGYVVERGGFYYFDNGDVRPIATTMIRLMRLDSLSVNFADWSDEERATACAAYKLKCDEYRKQQEERDKDRDVLVETARAKLTEEEFEAICEWSQS